MDKRELALKYIREDLPILELELETKLSESLYPDGVPAPNLNTETYYRKAGEVYQYTYIKKYMKELIYFYKAPTEETWLSTIDKQRIKKFLSLGNIWLILKVLSGIIPPEDRANKSMWDFISEGMKSILESIDKYEAGFTTEKTTKDTDIKLIKIDENGVIHAQITWNKPFWTIDIEVIDNNLDYSESYNIKLEWKDGSNGNYITNIKIENDMDLDEGSSIKLLLSKKVGEPSTFLTTNVFYALKNYLNKIEPLKISNNYFILTKQVNKVRARYIEEFDQDPSDRWIAYHLLIQKWEIFEMSEEEYEIYEKKKNKTKLTKEERKIYKNIDDVGYILRKEKDFYLYLTVNKNKRRAVMIKNKSVKNKNKSTYEDLLSWLDWNEDEYKYFSDFESILVKKTNEVKKIWLLYSGVDSLDQEFNDEDGKNGYDYLGDSSSLDTLKDSLSDEYQLGEFQKKVEVILSPREKFYLDLYFQHKVSLETLAEKGFYKSWNSSSNITEVRNILKVAMCKVLFYTKYKGNNY